MESLLVIFLMKSLPPRIIVIAITDSGRAISVLSRIEKPNLFKARFPKLAVLPFRIC
jgi:hypothetical protein